MGEILPELGELAAAAAEAGGEEAAVADEGAELGGRGASLQSGTSAGMTMGVTVDDAAALRQLEELQVALRDLRGFWPLLVPLFIGWMGATFATEGRAFESGWAPLSPAYALEKQRTHPGRSILIRDGTLRQAASRPSRVATARTLTLRIDDPVAQFHQEGTATMPARPLIPPTLPAAWARDIDAAATEYVSTLIRRFDR